MSKDEYYWNIAKTVSKRSTCLRASFGAIIIKNDSIVATGYVGAPRGTQSCDEMGKCLRNELKIPSGERYELCASVHAEQNVIIHAGREKCLDSTMYLCGRKYAKKEEKTKSENLLDAYPCFICKKIIINAGIQRLVANDSKGNLKIFKINDWVKEWKKHSLLEDKIKYKTNYE